MAVGSTASMACKIAGNVPVKLAPNIKPVLSVVAEITVFVGGWILAGLVNPGTVKAIAWSGLNTPELNVTVNTFEIESAAVPDGAGIALGKGEVNVSEADPEFASAIPWPESEMIILPLLGMGATGVREMLIVTPVAPLATLLRFIAMVPPDRVLLIGSVLI